MTTEREGFPASPDTVTIDRERWLRVHAAAWWAWKFARHPYLIALLPDDLDIDELWLAGGAPGAGEAGNDH
jgi:hypothetical protein